MLMLRIDYVKDEPGTNENIYHWAHFLKHIKRCLSVTGMRVNVLGVGSGKVYAVTKII